MPDKIAQKKNWMQDIFTPSTIGEKWSMTVMEGEQQRTRQTDEVAHREAEAAARHAQEVQPGHRQRDAAPVLHTASAAEQQAEQRHDQDVARGEESGLADRRIQQRELLGDAARAQRCAAAHTADNERFAGFAALLGRLLRMRAATFAQHRDDRQQDQSADDGAREHKGERADIIHADALRHERHTPDGGRQKQE